MNILRLHLIFRHHCKAGIDRRVTPAATGIGFKVQIHDLVFRSQIVQVMGIFLCFQKVLVTGKAAIAGLQRQLQQVEDFKREESRLLPENMDYLSIAGLRLEAREKLAQIRPMSIGPAGRISGVSPADIAVLLIWLEQNKT